MAYSYLMSATRTPTADMPKRHPRGRVCAEDGCGTILNPYNASEHCDLHQPAPDNRYCGYETAVCGECGEAIATSRRHMATIRTCGSCGAQRVGA